jgi:hypothetical protein
MLLVPQKPNFSTFNTAYPLEAKFYAEFQMQKPNDKNIS